MAAVDALGLEGAVLDVIVVGSGVAGLSVAVRLTDAGLAVGVVTKADLEASATRWAQGGVAAVLGADEDSTDLHLADTLAAGAGLCDVDAVRILVDEGPSRVEELIRLGAVFDREASGRLSLAREGGHSRPRILHAGGAATGAEVERALVAATWESATLVAERCFATDLLLGDDGVEGIVAIGSNGDRVVLRARHVVIATGGAGRLFHVTTNPREATADGLAMALRAGVPVADLEFMQFHPTALHHAAMPRPLLSEALRGHGALLRDAQGERFVDELASRDIVSRAMAAKMTEQGAEHLWLDATGLDHFGERFPTIAAELASVGLDPTMDWLPIAPAAHHLAGGIMTDTSGSTMLDGLWAAGEVADVGVHGANRLASNSLLEGMVFGARIAEAIEGGQRGPVATGVLRSLLDPESGGIAAEIIGASADRAVREDLTMPMEPAGQLAALQMAMTSGAGVVRSAEGLDDARAVVASVASRQPMAPLTPTDAELANLVITADALLAAALLRQESRGCHIRSEFPERSVAWERRIISGSVHR
jgi:L-aspartate oxidase